MNCPLIIFDTHPIQYRAPVFRAMGENLPGVKVAFFNSGFDGKKWWFQERDKIPKQDFGLNLVQGYDHFFLNTAQLNILKKISLLNKILEDQKPKAILIYGYYQIEHWILRMLSSRHQIPLIFVGETFDWRGSWYRKILKKLFIRFFFDQVKEFVSIGNKTTRYYENWGIQAQRITQAHYCTDTVPFEMQETEALNRKKETRKSLCIPEDAFVLLFVGRLFDRKRPNDLILIHRELCKKFKIHTLFVGNGELTEDLQRVSKDIPEIHWAGFKNHLELKNFYCAADLLVVPSEFETWGLVVNEAFSCGLPALVTDRCGVAEDLVVSGETGEIYPVGNISVASSKIQFLIENPGSYQKMSLSARKKVLSHYRPESFAQSILMAFRKVNSIEV